MRGTSRLIWTLAILLLPLIVAACDDSGTSPELREDPSATPDIGPTLAALAAAREIGTPTPTPVPPEERALLLEFAKGRVVLARDWDIFHAGFDLWRDGLAACRASAIETSLRQFAGQYATITQEAHGIPRGSTIVRPLVDKLIEAAQREERILRILRDSWDPGDPSLFDLVDGERAEASDLRKNVQDQLSDLQERTSPSARQLVTTYSSALVSLGSDWDAFHRSYDEFRAREADLTTLEPVNVLLLQLRAIVASIGALPTSEDTDAVTRFLSQAAQEENLLLRQLRADFTKVETGDGDELFLPSDDSLLAAFDAKVVETDATRDAARRELINVQEAASELNQAAIAQFAKEYGQHRRSWTDFNRSYDLWRSTDGGCDRTQALTDLGKFATEFGQLAGRSRALPRATFLRPVAEILVEAAESEELALRELRSSWQPFDSSVYDDLERERAASGKLRRQVTAGVQDLMDQFAISPVDLEQPGSAGQ